MTPRFFCKQQKKAGQCLPYYEEHSLSAASLRFPILVQPLPVFASTAFARSNACLSNTQISFMLSASSSERERVGRFGRMALKHV